jgi:hypothetical protein
MDDWVAGHLDADTVSARPFAHLPVLGVPGWWPDNETAGFYQDPAVFRPARRHAGASQ